MGCVFAFLRICIILRVFCVNFQSILLTLGAILYLFCYKKYSAIVVDFLAVGLFCTGQYIYCSHRPTWDVFLLFVYFYNFPRVLCNFSVNFIDSHCNIILTLLQKYSAIVPDLIDAFFSVSFSSVLHQSQYFCLLHILC